MQIMASVLDFINLNAFFVSYPISSELYYVTAFPLISVKLFTIFQGRAVYFTYILFFLGNCVISSDKSLSR